MSDLATEKLISLDEARCLPWLSKTYGFSTIWEWATVGRKAPDGTIVFLETRREPNRLCTSEEAMRRFIDRMSQAKPTVRTKTQAARAHDRATSLLANPGFKSASNRQAAAT